MAGRNRTRAGTLATATAVACGFALPAQALDIVFNDTTGIDPLALAGFEAAAQQWEAVLADDITVRLDIGFTQLDPGVLGSTGSTSAVLTYSDVFGALQLDATSIEDSIAAANLQTTPNLSFITNDAALNTILTTGFDNWNLFMDVNTANARALGLTTDFFGDSLDVLSDANITFNSDFAFDFDPTDGIDPGLFDFVGIAAHEIGHALGFVSGVDIIDVTSGLGPFADFVTDPPPDGLGLEDLSTFAVFNTLDLFRYSEASRAVCGTGPTGCLDLSVNGDLALLFEPTTLQGLLDLSFFSIDGGTTIEALFSGGRFNGIDGQQASHWFSDDFGITPTFGILDPTAGRGQLLSISDLDLLAFDVIGYDVRGLGVDVPEPGTLALLGLGLVGIGMTRRRRARV